MGIESPAAFPRFAPPALAISSLREDGGGYHTKWMLPPDHVWQVISDLESYSSWNPFMTKATGRVRGFPHQLSITIRAPGWKANELQAQGPGGHPNQRIRWIGRLLVPGLFDGAHLLQVEPLKVTLAVYAVRAIQWMLTWFAGNLPRRTLAGFEAMNAALKQRSEASA